MKVLTLTVKRDFEEMVFKETNKDFKLKSSSDKKYYVGNCVNGFDEDGECTIQELPYRDATDFAQAEEEAEDLTKNEFLDAAIVPDDLTKILNKKTTKFLKAGDILYMYDSIKDIHHFFS